MNVPSAAMKASAAATTAHVDSLWRSTDHLGASARAAAPDLLGLGNDAAEGAKRFAEAMEELNAAGRGWQGTLETIDGETVEAIKYYLEAGVAQDKLATAYELTAVQVKAVAASLQDEKEALKVLEEFHKKTHEIAMKAMQDEAAERKRVLDLQNQAVMTAALQIKEIQDRLADEQRKQTMTQTEYEIYKANEAAEAKIRAFRGVGEQVKVYEGLVRQELQATVDKTRGDGVTIIGGAKAIGDENQRAAATTKHAWEGSFGAAAAGFESFKGIVVAGTQAMINAMLGVSNAAERQRQMLEAQYGRGQFFQHTGFETALPTAQYRQHGGPVGADQPYVVGERGPELFVPRTAGHIVPRGSVQISVPVTINGSVLSDETKIARVVGDALLARLRTLGVRLAT
jgi:hypothetical protein